jgi:hypothetical protein
VGRRKSFTVQQIGARNLRAGVKASELVDTGVLFASILTAGDSVKKKHKGNETYRMAGISRLRQRRQDHHGVMNHELGASASIVRDHGSKGAFVLAGKTGPGFSEGHRPEPARTRHQLRAALEVKADLAVTLKSIS